MSASDFRHGLRLTSGDRVTSVSNRSGPSTIAGARAFGQSPANSERLPIRTIQFYRFFAEAVVAHAHRLGQCFASRFSRQKSVVPEERPRTDILPRNGVFRGLVPFPAGRGRPRRFGCRLHQLPGGRQIAGREAGRSGGALS